MRPCIIAGNWKMYKTIEEGVQFIQKLKSSFDNQERLIYLSVPYTMISSLAKEALDSSIKVGAQNMNDSTEGAFTGEIAAKMLKEVGSQFVLLGHSERRHIFGEDLDFIHAKLKQACREGIEPILCVGETLEERESGELKSCLEKQIKTALKGLEEKELSSILLAYEPVWAIGTGKSATPDDAEKAHQICRSILEEIDQDIASKIPILYGGSVKKESASSLLEKPNIDGLLIGGASLDVDHFASIIDI